MAQKRSIAEMSPVMSLLPGPLAALFDDAEVTGIMVDGPERISVERQGKVQDTSLRFDSNDEIKAAIRGLLKAAGVQIDEGRSVCEAQLGDHSRLLAVLSPAAINGHSLIIRKWSANPVTWEKLLEYRALTPPVRDLIQSALNAHVNILVAGGSASGKITMTNRIVELIPPDERVVSVEQTHEFQFNHPRAVFLEAGAAAHVSMDDLLMAGSRMRPDWLVVGELAGAEAARCMQLFSGGHSGITALHADSLENALARLEAMCRMARLGLEPEDIRAMIASGLRLVLYQEYLASTGSRKVTHISELRGMINGRYMLQPLMRYDPLKDEFEMTGARPGWE